MKSHLKILRFTITTVLLLSTMNCGGKQTDAEKKPTSINGRIIIENPPLPEKQTAQPIIVAPQFVMHTPNKHHKMKLKNQFGGLPSFPRK